MSKRVYKVKKNFAAIDAPSLYAWFMCPYCAISGDPNDPNCICPACTQNDFSAGSELNSVPSWFFTPDAYAQQQNDFTPICWCDWARDMSDGEEWRLGTMTKAQDNYNELQTVLKGLTVITNTLDTVSAASESGVLSPVAKSDMIVAITKALDSLQYYIQETIISKGWLPSGTSQNDLPDSAFLWISNDYKSGKSTDKASGRKFPVKGPDGKVDPKGWQAAHNILEGGMGGGDFGGGPSHDDVMSKLMACKPSDITVKDGHTTTEKSQPQTVEHNDGSLDESSDYSGQVIAKAFVPIEKSNVRLGIIFGKASVANIFDRQGHRIKEDVLEKAAYNFMANQQRRATNTHKETIPGVFVASWVENGIWSIGFKPDDINIVKGAEQGLWTGFSIGGTGNLIPATD